MGGSIVKRLTMAVLFAAIAATPALAAKYILVKDTVGNCSPSPPPRAAMPA